MLWKPMIVCALLVLSIPALADEKGDALVQDWLARSFDIQPVTVETTVTYRVGKLSAVYKHRISRTPNHSGTSMRPYRHDNDYPFELFNDPLGDNFNPLPDSRSAMERMGLGPTGSSGQTKYLGKETVEGTEYDVVEIHEILVGHISPVPHMLQTLKRTPDGRIAIKWYIDSRGVVQRMTYTSEIPLPDHYLTFRSAFDPPPKKAPDSPAAAPMPPSPAHTETFTATMVVDNYHKTRMSLARPGLSEPIYTVPLSSESFCAFSPDGTLLAIRNTNKLQIVLASTGQPKVQPQDIPGRGRMDFSLDGKSLAMLTTAGITVIRTEDGKPVRSIAVSNIYGVSPRLSPDGRRIAVTHDRLGAEIWNVETGALERTLKSDGPAYETAFSADGKKLAVAVVNSDTQIWDTDTWQIVGRLPNRTLSRTPLALSRDGRYIATVNEDNIVQLWDGAAYKPIKELKGAGGLVRSLTFSADGKALLAGNNDDQSDFPTGAAGFTNWNLETGLVTANCSPWQRKDIGVYGRCALSPDGRFAAFPGSPTAAGSVAVFALPSEKRK